MASIGTVSDWISSSNGKSFISSLHDPITFDPLTDAILLVTCGHTISQVAIERIERGSLEPSCPLCRTRVTGHYPNRVVKNLVKSLTPPVCAKVAADPKVDLSKVPFPGKRGDFELTHGDWRKDNTPELDPNRKLEFTTQTSDSFFKKIHLLGYKNGNVLIFIKFNENDDEIESYLSNCGIKLNFNNKSRGYYVSNKITTSLLFQILKMHNTFPEKELSLMESVISSQIEPENTQAPLDFPEENFCFKDAVILIPCLHTVSKIAIERLSSCSLCHEQIETCYPNLVVQSLADSLGELRLEEVRPVVFGKIATNPIVDLSKVPFPGKGGHFKLASGDWREYNIPDLDLNRQLEFTTQTSGSSFKEVLLLEYKSGDVLICIKFNENDDEIKSYLSNCGINVRNGFYSPGFYRSDTTTTPLLFQILMLHNEFPQEYISLMRNVIAF